jgi:hypothetical protein
MALLKRLLGLDRNLREEKRQAKLDRELAYQKKRVTTRQKRIAVVRTKEEADAPIKPKASQLKKGKTK